MKLNLTLPKICFLRFALLLAHMALLMGAVGCKAIPVNQPRTDMPHLSIQPLQDTLTIGVKTTFSGGNARYAKFGNDMSRDLVSTLQASPDLHAHYEFRALPSFGTKVPDNVDFVLEVSCRTIEEQKEKNPYIFAICLPAAFSIIATPIGIIGLSLRGAVQEQATYTWTYQVRDKDWQIVSDIREFETESVVSATGWGSPEDVLEQAFKNTHPDVFAAGIELVNATAWPNLAAKIKPTIKPPIPDQVAPPVQIATDADRYAVIVGVSRYKHGSLSELSYADADANAVYRLLIDGGWQENNIKLLTNEQATKRDVSLALESWLTQAKSEDIVMLYWSGHGFPDPSDPTKVYFACHDTDANVPATGLRMDRVRSFLDELLPKNMILIADTCHAGKLITRNTKGMAVMPYFHDLQEKQAIPPGWIFMVGADSDRTAVENGKWGHGAFTYCLLKGLSGESDGYDNVNTRDGKITVGELRSYLRDKMPEETLTTLGKALHPLISTSSGDQLIWEIPLTEPKGTISR